MTQITIQCRLIAQSQTRQFLWQLMAEKNTPLINEILLRIKEHPDFPEWRQKRRLTKNFLSQQISELKQDCRFREQPSRFYASVNKLISYIYKSWFKVQQKLQNKLAGNLLWWEMLQPDSILIEQCGGSLDSLQQQASAILTEIELTKSKDSIAHRLFQKYEQTKRAEIKSAITYLLKNGCSIPHQPETNEQFEQLKRKVEIKIARLKRQIESRIPTGRDLEDRKWLETLIIASTTVPTDQLQVNSWYATLMKKGKSVPYPILYETNEDLSWSLNHKNRLCLRFSGLGKHSFEIYCHRRQLVWFKRFYEDQQLKKQSQDQLSSTLFTLRSAIIIWKETKNKGKPWQKNQLYLHCTLETDCWTAEGTQARIKEKLTEIHKLIEHMKEKEKLTQTQEAFIRKKYSTLAKLQNSFPRPSKPLYQGNQNIYLGVALGLDQPVTLAIVDLKTNRAIAYRNLKQLLKEDYQLIGKRRKEKQRLSHQRHKLGKKLNFKQQGESNLGEYLDRLIAKAILTVAQEYQVSTIVVPRLNNIREITEVEIKMRAEKRVPEYKEGQKKYAQEYRVQVHQWSYGRLIESISARAKKVGLLVKEAKQVLQGTLTEKALRIVLNREKEKNQTRK